jgi:signal transduction histidine kinase
LRPPAKIFAAATNHIGKPVRLPSDLRSLDLQFTALNFSEPEKIHFRHRLDGSDPDWVESGPDRSVHYGRLLYGNYTFRVQAGSAGVWDKNEAAFSFVIPTPWWRTAWALTIYVLAAVILVAGTARLVSNRRLRRRLAVLAQQQAMERERMRIAQDMHDEIGSKLTKISFMSERAKGELQGQEPVARKLNSIANTSRDLLQSLDEIVWAVNPHNDTLEHLAAYLGHYATEYLQNTAVECELHIPQGLPHHPLSAEARHNLFLAFEEALNNALKHGRAARIRVAMRAAPGQFEINVEDNGCGFDVEAITSAKREPAAQLGKRIGNGMKNLQLRLADVGGKCRIRSQPGQGTTVTLTVPLAAARNHNKRK